MSNDSFGIFDTEWNSFPPQISDYKAKMADAPGPWFSNQSCQNAAVGFWHAPEPVTATPPSPTYSLVLFVTYFSFFFPSKKLLIWGIFSLLLHGVKVYDRKTVR